MKEIKIQDREIKKYTRRSWLSFVKFFALTGIGFAGWRWLYTQPLDGGILGGIPEPLRKGLEINEKLFKTTFNSARLVKEYAKSDAAKKVRVNGDVGLDTELFEPKKWTLEIQKAVGKTVSVKLEELMKLPKTEVVYNFKCIEGWSQVSWWGGVRFADFANHFGLEKELLMNYVGMSTPDFDYYVGIDMESALHPQTILAYEMNGKPLPMQHGYPLRLIIPVKYGVKSLKRIGSIYFDNEKPSDYWAERGYDYYIGL
ncbi:molybdopterin-dependent oxidoreductase [Runella sp.]|uniref:molybdopterin-dependent oxidoreductase n=1 Tax=Runella sp. TaxID=1960881 RepID=UPI003D13838F